MLYLAHWMHHWVDLLCVLKLYRSEAAARATAEASEAQALQAAAEHAHMFETLLQEVLNGREAKQRQAKAAVLQQIGCKQPGQRQQQQELCSKSSAPDSPVNSRDVCADSAGSASAALQQHSQCHNTMQTIASHGVHAAQAQRPACHRQIQKRLAVNRKALAEAARRQKRATAAAQLEESKQVSKHWAVLRQHVCRGAGQKQLSARNGAKLVKHFSRSSLFEADD
jgi:hypothetical protein